MLPAGLLQNSCQLSGNNLQAIVLLGFGLCLLSCSCYLDVHNQTLIPLSEQLNTCTCLQSLAMLVLPMSSARHGQCISM